MTKYEVIEVQVLRQTGNQVHATTKTVAICLNPTLAESTLISLATAAYLEAAAGSQTIKAYSVRPLEISLPGFE